MSEAIAFDTHRFVKNLTASGFTEAQAEALAGEQVHLFNSSLATKADIRGTKADIRRAKADLEAKIETVKAGLEVKIEAVRADLEVKIETVRASIETARVDLSRWMLAGWVTQTGLIATIFWYFFSGLPGG